MIVPDPRGSASLKGFCWQADADRSLQSEPWEQPARENYLMLYLQLMDQSIMYQGTLCFHALGHNSLSPPDGSVTHVQDYPMIGNATEQA